MNNMQINETLGLASIMIKKKARNNIKTWGLQDKNILLKAMMEELGG